MKNLINKLGYLILLIIFSPILFCSFAQIEYKSGSPAWLIDKYFNHSNFENKANYFTGEMLDEEALPTIGEELGKEIKNEFRILYEDSLRTVYSVEVKIDSKILDFYCYILNTETGWKIEAIRRFLLPSFIYIAADSLALIENLSAKDSSMYNLLALLTANDKQLKKHLEDNVNRFYDLVWFFEQEDNDNLKKLLSELNMTAVFRDNLYPGCIFIQIEAFETREVGFIFAEDSTSLPKLSPNKFIYIEEVLPNWYIYRII